jgi:tRNA (cytosine38-C5)-methyltransferase
MDGNREIRAIEWFSGIGGMHYALNLTRVPATVVAAIDINEMANRIYKHNFGKDPVTKNIENLPLGWIEKWNANTWLMSPPCQPYTQGGKQLDDRDNRAAGFLRLLELLPQMKQPPSFIFLENVPYFEMSNCHAKLLDVLKPGYIIEEYMVAPTDPYIGIPNRRKRYYLIARRKGCFIPTESRIEEIYGNMPFGSDRLIYDLNQVMKLPNLSGYPTNRPLSSYLETLDKEEIQKYHVPFDFIRSAKEFRFDIVSPTSPNCATFTKAYGTKYVIGSGSFLQTREFDMEYEPDDQEKLFLLGLRFFTPMEIADLHAFPDDFSFPENVSIIHKYRVLGNGLNIAVVASILHRLFFCPEV